MTYQTLEVELDNGRISPVAAEQLPAKARALLTILTPAASPEDGGKVEGTTLADLTRDLAGIGNDSHTDLSSKKSHLDDLGE